ncbi:MAG: hypothetical protein COB51_02525 [Moraxellaceae bacterium]|nr:MAG: hypothetical protein COB51_02525 [Moraxellaceae bacterium]
MVITGIYAWLLFFGMLAVISGIPVSVITYKCLVKSRNRKFKSFLFAAGSGFIPMIFVISCLAAVKVYAPNNDLYFFITLIFSVIISIFLRVWFDVNSGAAKEKGVRPALLH